MDFFKKRHVAVIIACIIVIGSTIWGAHRSLGNESNTIAGQFSAGVNDASAGYRLPSIRSQLEVRSAASLNLLTVASHYNEVSNEASALRNARNTLMEMLEDENKGPKALYAANHDLTVAFEDLYIALATYASDTEQADMNQDYSRMSNAALVIDRSGYNESVRDFNQSTLGIFPANVLKHLTFVEQLELFE